MRHPVSAQPELPAAGGLSRDLHGDLTLEGRDFHLGAQGGIRHVHGKVHVEIVAFALEARIRFDRDPEVEIAAPTAAARPRSRDPDARARVHARRDLHVEVASPLRPARAVTLRTRVAIDVSRPPARRAGLVQLERDRLANPTERLLEREVDRRLDVAARARRETARTPLRAAAAAQIAELYIPEAASTAAAADQVAEDGPEKVGERTAVSLLESDLLSFERRAATRIGSRIALPVGAQGVIALALLRVGQHGVRLVDLLEALRRALVDVGMVLPGKLPVRRLDGLVIGGLRHSEDLVVVLVLHVLGK